MPQIFTLPKQVVIDPLTGNPSPGAKAYFYITLTSMPQPVYSDAARTTPITQPVVADAAGFLQVMYLSSTTDYKMTLMRSDDSLLYTTDPIDSLTGVTVYSTAIRYDITPAEDAAGVMPVNYNYQSGHIIRYGANAVPGTTDMSAAILSAIKSGSKVVGNSGDTYFVGNQIAYTGLVNMDLTGITIISNVLTFKFTDATGSRIKGPKFLPATVPYTILRTPGSWTNVAADVTQKYGGYMPTGLDTDFWSSLSAGIQNQTTILHPGFYFTISTIFGASDIEVTGVSGYCACIIVEGYSDARIHDNNYGCNGYTYSGILLNNGTTRKFDSSFFGFTCPRGVGNQVHSNILKYASTCGVTFFGQDQFALYGNNSSFNGESGFKLYAYDGAAGPSETTNCWSTKGRIFGNQSNSNYYDGFDLSATYGVAYQYAYGGHTFYGNRGENNRHTCLITNYSSMTITGNHANSNGTHGLSVIGSNNLIVANTASSNCNTGTTLIAQPFDIFIQGDDCTGALNNILNASAPATYNYLHSGFNGANPTSSHEGIDFGNYCDGGPSRMAVSSTIGGAINGAYLKPFVQTNGYLAASAVISVSANSYTVLATDSSIKILPSATHTITLPAAASFVGRELTLFVQAAFAVNSASSNVFPIAGGAAGTAILSATAGKWARLQSDGTGWFIVSSN